MVSPHTIILIAGPTATGKSALALDVAEKFNGTIINADSLQMYKDLRVLSARPEEEALERVPHKLYGVWDGAERGSVAKWRTAALTEIAETQKAGQLPILVGGTGLYFKALTEGIAPVPSVSEETIQAANQRWEQIGPEAFHAEILKLDPILGQRLKIRDRQRLTRAWAVATETGRPLSVWQSEQPERSETEGYHFIWIVLDPPREELYAACNQRFLHMVKHGAVEEVRALMARGLDTSLPVMKAVGVPELSAYLNNDVSLEDAIAHGQQATRNYAKRQVTWFRGQVTKRWEGKSRTPGLIVSEIYCATLRDKITGHIKKGIG